MDKNQLIDAIITLETEMFLAVKTEGECACQDNIDNFAFHRKVQFIAWNAETLKLYLDHISKSWSQDINLMTIKYARMEDQIPTYSSNPLIDKIAAQAVKWQREVKALYPKFMARSRPITDENSSSDVRSFDRYFKGELETYSDNVLSSLFAHISESVANGVNLSLVSYEYMVKELGYKDMADVEARLD